MKRWLPVVLGAGALLAITYYAYNVGPISVVNGILAILLLLRLFGRPSGPVRADGGHRAVQAPVGPARREEPGERTEIRPRAWPGQGLVRGGTAMR